MIPQDIQPLAAEEIVRLIMDDLNARAGYDLSNVDGEILNEIKQKWASIILNNMPTPAQAKLPLMADKFTPSQKQMLSLGVAVIDELRPMLTANNLSENDASEICYQLTIKLRDRLENNADFRGLTAQANHAAMLQAIERISYIKTIAERGCDPGNMSQMLSLQGSIMAGADLAIIAIKSAIGAPNDQR